MLRCNLIDTTLSFNIVLTSIFAAFVINIVATLNPAPFLYHAIAYHHGLVFTRWCGEKLIMRAGGKED